LASLRETALFSRKVAKHAKGLKPESAWSQLGWNPKMLLYYRPVKTGKGKMQWWAKRIAFAVAAFILLHFIIQNDVIAFVVSFAIGVLTYRFSYRNST
jgi:hypothetical protein